MRTFFGGRRAGWHAWLIGTSCLTVLGFVAALVFINWFTLLITFLATAGVVASIHLNVAAANETMSRALLAVVVRLAVKVGIAVIAVCGYVSSAGLATVPLLAVVAATAPLALARRTAGADEPPVPAGRSITTHDSLPDDLSALSDDELCGFWRRSFGLLQACESVQDTEEVAAVRQRCLDELERRQPAAFAEWMKSARAGGDPTRYYVPNSDRGDLRD